MSRLTLFLITTITAVACVGAMPPPPELHVTSPKRGMVQSAAGRVVVEGTAVPGTDGSPIAKVVVNGVTATLAVDGSFSATIDLPPGAILLQTVASTQEGGAATDARAVQIGELRPVGTNIERAITASLSVDAFARLSAAAGPLVKAMDLTALLAPMQPLASLGDSDANVKISINKLSLGDAKFKLTPVDGGLEFSAELTGLDVVAKAAYGGTFVPDGSTTVTFKADALTLSGTLVVTPAGTAGFTTKITSPVVRATNLKLGASGIAGSILTLLEDNLGSTVTRIVTSSAERAFQPLITVALGALAGPQHFTILGKSVELQVSPSVVTFSRAGALVTLNMLAKIAGSEASPGYIFTPNGTPNMNVGSGIHLGLSDDLINELLAEVHALGLLDLDINEDFGIFDRVAIKLTLPPMIGAGSTDGKLRLVLGDMVAAVSKQGKPLISAAINAQVDLEVLRGDNAEQIALAFGKVNVFVNLLDGDGALNGSELEGAAAAGIGFQLDSLKQFLITVPVPAVAGVTLDNLALRADSGYVVVSGQVH